MKRQFEGPMAHINVKTIWWSECHDDMQDDCTLLPFCSLDKTPSSVSVLFPFSQRFKTLHRFNNVQFNTHLDNRGQKIEIVCRQVFLSLLQCSNELWIR